MSSATPDECRLPSFVPRVVHLQVVPAEDEIERAASDHRLDGRFADEGEGTELVADLGALEMYTPQFSDAAIEPEQAAQLAHLHPSPSAHRHEVEAAGT